MELVTPSKEMTKDGCVSDVVEAKKVLEFFKRENIQALIIGNMTFGMEVAVGTVLSGIAKDMPILHFATRSGPIAPDGSRATDTWCGQFMTASAIKRRGFTFIHLNTCNPEDTYFKEKREVFTENQKNFVHSKYSPLMKKEPTKKKIKTSKIAGKKVGRNDPCPCGSGKKYKKCCGK